MASQEALLLHRLALTLGTSEAAVRAAIEAIADRNAETPAKRLLPGTLEADEVVVLFTSESIAASKLVTVLEDATRPDHDAQVTAGHAVRYAVCYRTYNPPADVNEHAVEVHAASQTGFAPPATPGRAVTATMGAIGVTTIDVEPSALTLSNRRSAEIVTRTSPLLEDAKATAGLLDRGVASADVDGALTKLCSWLYETGDLVDQQWDAAVAAVYASLRESATVAAPPASADTALAAAEAVLRRYTTLQLALNVALDERGPFQQLIAAADGASTGRAALQQRVAALKLTANGARRDAWALVPAVQHLVTVKLHDSVRLQSVNSLAAHSVEQLGIALLFAGLVAPRSSDSARVTSGFLERTLQPAIAGDFVTQVDRMLDVRALMQCKDPEDIAATDDVVPKADSELAPPIVAEVKRGQIHEARLLLARWCGAVDRALSVTRRPEHALQLSAVRLVQPGSTAPPYAAAAYAEARLADLLALADRVLAEGCGLLPPTCVCLFNTVAFGLRAFAALRVHTFRNWAKLCDTFERTVVLKYTEVDTGREYAEPIADVVAPAPTAVGTPGAPQRSDADTDDEKALLRGRVVTLTTELNECRRLLTQCEERATVAERSAAAAAAENATLREELRQLRLAQSPQRSERGGDAVEAAAPPSDDPAPADANQQDAPPPQQQQDAPPQDHTATAAL